MDRNRRRRLEWRWIALIGTLAVAAVALAAFVVTRGSDLPPASSGYAVHIASGITPSTSADRAAAIARHYLDLQTPELAAPGIHTDPIVLAVSAVRAADAAQLEPGVPAAAIAADPERVVWVAEVTGDLLNLDDLRWSRAGAPYSAGDIVIDDETGAVLGVYPGGPGPNAASPAPTSAATTPRGD